MYSSILRLTLSLIILSTLTIACSAKHASNDESIVQTRRDMEALKKSSGDPLAFCQNLPTPSGVIYEIWNLDSKNAHFYDFGLDIEVGAEWGNRYLERKTASPWLAPEYITTEQAKDDALFWAGGRYLRWLTGTTATFHFPFYPQDWEGDIYVEVALRPKVNPSGAIRFYRPDGKGGREWSQPLTADFSPGWRAYRWKVPREYLSDDGRQMMRISFPNSYFEGTDRVSAKFSYLALTNDLPRKSAFRDLVSKGTYASHAIEALPTPVEAQTQEGLFHALSAYSLDSGHRIDRFFVPPEGSHLSFYIAPTPFLERVGTLNVEIQMDSDLDEENFDKMRSNALSHGIAGMADNQAERVVALPTSKKDENSANHGDLAAKSVARVPKTRSFLKEIEIKPGECWKWIDLDLAFYAKKAVRVSISFNDNGKDDGFSAPMERLPKFYLTPPEVRVRDALTPLKSAMKAKRVVVLAIDNLRADRLTAVNKNRAVPYMSKLAKSAISGVMLASGLSPSESAASFLTSMPRDVHGVIDTSTHLRSRLTLISEAIEEMGWKSEFYSTSGFIDPAKGFAQGFDVVRALNKENIVSSASALKIVSQAVSQSSEKTLFYVHLSELRLPYKASDERMAEWGVPNYAGPVTPQAMQNLIVVQNPTSADAQQIEAYYDGELSEIDAAIGEFVAHLPEDTLVLWWGTHGNSLGETHISYGQTLSPWELLTPFSLFVTGTPTPYEMPEIVAPEELSATLLDLVGAALPANAHTIFESHDSRPEAHSGNASATATRQFFYRIRREGVDVLYSTGLDGVKATEIKGDYPILKEVLREKID